MYDERLERLGRGGLSLYDYNPARHVGWVQCNYIITVCPIYKIIPRVTSLHLGAPSYSSGLRSQITGIIMDRVRRIVSLAQCEIFSLKCFK